MRTNITALPAQAELPDLFRSLRGSGDRGQHGQRLYPVVDEKASLVGVVTRNDLQTLMQAGPTEGDRARQLADVINRSPVVAYPDETLRTVMDRMAETGLTRFPVVDRGNPRKLVGMIALTDILKARRRTIEGERRRERVLRLHILFPRRGQRSEASEKTAAETGSPSTRG